MNADNKNRRATVRDNNTPVDSLQGKQFRGLPAMLECTSPRSPMLISPRSSNRSKKSMKKTSKFVEAMRNMSKDEPPMFSPKNQSQMEHNLIGLFSKRHEMGNDGMFIVDSGKCQIVNDGGDEKVFTEIGRGDYFGESVTLK